MSRALPKVNTRFISSFKKKSFPTNKKLFHFIIMVIPPCIMDFLEMSEHEIRKKNLEKSWKIAKNTTFKVPLFMFTLTTFIFIFNER